MTDNLQPEAVLDITECTLQEVCQLGAFDEYFVIQCVEHGIATVSGQQRVEWLFPAHSVLRIRKAWRLHRDLDVHLGSLALLLELLEERDRLHQEVIELRQRLRRWEQD